MQHLRAASVGGDIAPDHARPLRPQAQRQQAVMRGRHLLQGLQHAARFHRHGEAFHIHINHPVHPPERQQNAGMRRPRRCSTHQPGIAALRHDGHVLRGAKLHHGGNFLGAARPHHHRRAPLPLAGPVGHKRHHRVGVRHQAAIAHNGVNLRKQRRGYRVGRNRRRGHRRHGGPQLDLLGAILAPDAPNRNRLLRLNAYASLVRLPLAPQSAPAPSPAWSGRNSASSESSRPASTALSAPSA